MPKRPKHKDRKKHATVEDLLGFASVERTTEQNGRLALLLASACVRNTIIEEYHGNGKITDPEMMAFNKEVANKLFTALEFLHNPEFGADRDNYLSLVAWFYPTEWDKPELDEGVLAGIDIMLGRRDPGSLTR